MKDLFGVEMAPEAEGPVKAARMAEKGIVGASKEAPPPPFRPYSIVRVSPTAVWLLHDEPSVGFPP